MKLLEISADILSLEFRPDEELAIMDRLGKIGQVDIVREATFDRIRVKGVEITYLNEWDEPCLIAGTPEARALLRAVVVYTDSPIAIAADRFTGMSAVASRPVKRVAASKVRD